MPDLTQYIIRINTYIVDGHIHLKYLYFTLFYKILTVRKYVSRILNLQACKYVHGILHKLHAKHSIVI